MVFRVDGRTVVLADDVRDELRDRADGIVRRCDYDGGDKEQRVWTEALAAPSFIRLTYAMPIELRLPRREVLISKAVFLVRDPNFLEQPVLRHDERTTLVFKCDGTDMLKLMCMPALAAYFPPGYQGNCHIVRKK